MTGHKVEFYSGSFEVDGTHMGYLAVRLWRTPTVKVWVQAACHRLSVIERPVARIYKNPARRFWGGLDDEHARRAYYRRVLESEVAHYLPQRLPLLQLTRLTQPTQ